MLITMLDKNEEIEFISNRNRNKFIKDAREALKDDSSNKKDL